MDVTITNYELDVPALQTYLNNNYPGAVVQVRGTPSRMNTVEVADSGYRHELMAITLLDGCRC